MCGVNGADQQATMPVVLGYPQPVKSTAKQAPWFWPLSVPVAIAAIVLVVAIWRSAGRRWLVYIVLRCWRDEAKSKRDIKRADLPALVVSCTGVALFVMDGLAHGVRLQIPVMSSRMDWIVWRHYVHEPVPSSEIARRRSWRENARHGAIRARIRAALSTSIMSLTSGVGDGRSDGADLCGSLSGSLWIRGSRT